MADATPTEYEGPWLVSAGSPGNRRLGALLKSLRERSKLSPQELADQADVHVSFVRGIERGAQAPSMETAHRLLDRMKEQRRIRWMDGEPCDLLILDPDIGQNVAFEFKAEKKGQNRRPDQLPEGALAGLRALAEAWRGVPSSDEVAATVLPALQALAGAVPQAVQGQPRSPADEATFGRVVRLLAGADEETLGKVERLLLDEPGPERSG